MENEIPYGYCQCGCGQRTTLAEQNDPKHGYVKGEPKRFVLGHSFRMLTFPDPIEKFWMYTNKDDPTRCWEWNGPRNAYGYGVITRKGSGRFRAHRLSYEIHFGEIPDGMLVCHRCDNPACVNPNHLFLGSITDNMSDKVSKGRHIHGETVPASKLTDSAVVSIRQMAEEGHMIKDIALAFGVTRSTISSAVCRKTWKHVK